MPLPNYAILIGLPRPGSQGAAEALRVGRDIAAMRAWLLDPAGGNVAPGRLRCVASAAGATRPPLAQVEMVTAELEAQSRRNVAAGRGPRLGRRLTLFISGQACLPGLYRPATPPRPGAPLVANAWLGWAQLSGMFREVVLWLDCGLDDPAYLSCRDLPPPAGAASSAGPAMVVLATRPPFQPAIIQPGIAGGRPDGASHGALTWALLEGLRGAAADAHGKVTGRSLADWLRHAQAARLPADAPPGWSREPEVIQADAALLLAEGRSLPHFPVLLRLPAAALGQPVRLWHGSPPRLDGGLGLGRARMELALTPGLYVAEVPGAGLRHGFEVVGPTDLLLDQPGPPVRADPAGPPLELVLESADPTAQCTVVDSRFALARRGIGGLRASLSLGLYKLRSRQGRALRDQVLLLDRATTLPAPGPLPAPPLLPPRLPVAHAAGEAVLRLSGVSRQGVSVVDAHGLTVLDLAYDGEPQEAGATDMVSCALALPPGGYFLRRRLGGAHGGMVPMVEQSLVLVPGWALEVHVPPLLPGAPPPPVGLLMHALAGPPPGPEQARLMAALGMALADRRRILTPALLEALTSRVVDPLAGILAGQLLLLEREYDPGRDLSALNGLVRQLRLLLGPLHPDVKALALCCPDESLRPSRPLPVLPMFLRSWRLLVAGSHRSRALLPRRLWERAVARSAQAPLLAWSMDGRQRQAMRQEMAQAVWASSTQVLAGAGAVAGNVVSFARTVPVKSARSVARRRALLLDVPLSALDLLAEVYEDGADG